MSVTLILFPLAIALGSSLSATTTVAAGAVVGVVGSKAALAVAAEANLRHLKHLRELYVKSQSETIPPMETIFIDGFLLEKTLREHGLFVTIISENEIVCNINDIQLNYVRQNQTDPFFVNITGIKDMNEFWNEIDCFEREYLQNVQSFTYNKLVESLAQNNMKIAKETVLEDNSIMLTIDI